MLSRYTAITVRGRVVIVDNASNVIALLSGEEGERFHSVVDMLEGQRTRGNADFVDSRVEMIFEAFLGRAA